MNYRTVSIIQLSCSQLASYVAGGYYGKIAILQVVLSLYAQKRTESNVEKLICQLLRELYYSLPHV